MNPTRTSRRDFLQKSLVTGAGIAAGLRAASLGGIARADYDPSTVTAAVGITRGPDRADNAFRSLQLFKKQIAAAIGNKRVVIKINMVVNQFAAYTRPEHTEGILEFLKSIGKRDVVITESPSGGNAFDSFNYAGYWPLIKKYPVKLLDLNQEGFFYGDIWQYGDSGNPNYNVSRRIRICKMYLNPDHFVISAAPIKTHNTVVVTLAGKNVGMSAPYMDIGGAFSQSGAIKEKAYMHGINGSPPGDYQCLNDNVYRILAVYRIRPHLAVIDGFQGTEHNGPHAGTLLATPQQLAVTSMDWLAADRIALTLMGANVYRVLNHTPAPDHYPMPYPAVLNYCWQAGCGEWDDRKIQIIGDLGQMKGNALVGNPVVWNYQSYDNMDTLQLGMDISPRNNGDGVPLVNQVIA